LCDTPIHIRGLAVFTECLAVGLACGDQRRLTGSGSALEALRDDALYKFTYFSLLFYCMKEGIIVSLYKGKGSQSECS